MLIACAALAIMSAAVGKADTIGPVRYDASGNQLIVTISYDGANPNHRFSIRWGRCRKLRDQIHGPARKIINLGIVDDQGDDAARKNYVEVVRVPLAGLSCRPAAVTVRTSPDSYASLATP